MVSKASDDVPEPESRVTTTSPSRGEIDVDVLEVVDLASPNGDPIGHGCSKRSRWPAPNHPVYLASGQATSSPRERLGRARHAIDQHAASGEDWSLGKLR